MRFDDMIATVLAQPADRPDRRSAQWRQLVDLLAQPRSGGEEKARALAYLRERRGGIPASDRLEAAKALIGLAIDPDLILFFAEDSTSVSAPLIAGARLEAEDWLGLLPRLGPRGRALLRNRSDLPAPVRQALAAFGAADFVLEGAGPAAEAATGEPAESQIQELVERIEAFRRHKEAPQEGSAAQPISERSEGFRFETGSEGTFRWVHGAPREALVGQSIAAIAGPGQHGVDGQAAGAFEKRAPFRDARFSVAGEGAASGDWRLSGVPFFDPHRGTFMGYRGTARRPRIDDTANPAVEAAGVIFGARFPADSMRQLIHELRTPLNAIIGFAEMIEGQYMGPAASGYRGQAVEIIEQARRLLSAVDDLDTAARLETQRLQSTDGMADSAALLGRLHESYERIAGQRGAKLVLQVSSGLPPARVEAGAVERMFARLLSATIGLAGGEEEIAARLDLEGRASGPALRLSVDRPRAIAGLDEEALLDPGYSPEGDWPAAPALGLGFALRLVRNLAEAAGGGLEIGDAEISLYLPALVADLAPAGQSDGSA
jgi:signal transduction histidine kinase